jgi:hypothetical protein
LQDVSSTIQADIHRLESGLRQLKVQYDMFFNGALDREPHELRADIERLIKRNSNSNIRKYAHRFHFNTLVSRYNSLSELWGRTLREREGGDRRKTPDRRTNGERVLRICRIADPARDEAELRDLHRRYVAARARVADTSREISFEAFRKGVTAQTSKLRKRSERGRVELRLVVEEDRVQLKARLDKT